MSSVYKDFYSGAPQYAVPPPTAFAGYGAPAPQSYYLPQPVPAPPVPVYMDPQTFRHHFATRLQELTVNSRPIIQGLSMMASDNTQYANIVSDCLQSHIRRVQPWAKLPALYLLDMISKNIHDPYARLFASFIIPVFLESYGLVDPSTRNKMDELVITWRTASPTRRELFGAAAQLAIERGMGWGAGSTASHEPISKAQVLSELEFTLGQKERAVQSNPLDSLSQQHVAVLQQLRHVVEAGVSQAELQQILTQLRSIVQPSHVSPPLPSHPPTLAPPAAPSWTPAQYASNMQASYPSPPMAEAIPTQHSLPCIAPASTSSNYSNLLSSLLKAGVVGTPTQILTPPPAPTSEDDDIAYRTSILNHSVQLSTVGITGTPPRIAELLYATDSEQCKQCGLRFPQTPYGKDVFQQHLDTHYQQNRKVNDNLGRGYSRSWFVVVEDWISDAADVKGKGPAGPRISAAAAEVADRKKRHADLQAQTVVVPPGDEAKSLACPICKETMTSEFLEDDEDWVWRNATVKEGKVYHATCLADTSTNTLASRLMGQRSRSATPEHRLKESTPEPLSSSIKLEPNTPDRIVGVKRKMGDDAIDGSPPVKKMAIANI
ncbi:hypothetical protein CYLTODRAFT_422057 [Cylindrobasidium torrendii FP15055 ss-10]|uniref:CID domain-containing protein n=1 Tax=Cylindrobasidium torrendii FP15055 ss-10 TaxID=1314674 RepID=A0A0D7BCN4_9AGAR|nr:hypothetical protein CYLTODRAFT_422057 [Cylindrobasidium torrendii FP15055 ss-10]